MNNTTATAAQQDQIRFAVIASCMTPRGAWAKSHGGTNSLAEAQAMFNVAGFLRPDSGIAWGMQIDLVCVKSAKGADGLWRSNRTTLATRNG